MSLYRQAARSRRRRIAVGAALVAAVGGIILLISIGGDGGEQDAGDVGPAADRLSAAIELVELHYGRSVNDGRVVDEALFSSVNDQLDAASEEFESLAPLLPVSVARFAQRSLTRLRDTVNARGPALEVEGLARLLRSRLGSLSS
jgi:hypothetical protein